MAAKIGVLVVHGMGNQPADYAEEMVDELTRRLKRLGTDPELFGFQSAFWGAALNGREEELYANLARGNHLDWEKIRRDIVVSGLGDAMAYAGPSTGASVVYDAIHRDIERALERLRDGLDDGANAPLVILSHSLGCQIMSNYLWDAQKGNGRSRGEDAFTKGETLCTWITYGCNIPLFTLALAESDVAPIAFPGAKAASAFPGNPPAEVFKWLNFYDPDDVLGFPLKGISPAYDRVVTADRAIDTGTVLTSHTAYWTDNNFTRPVAKQLKRLAQLL